MLAFRRHKALGCGRFLGEIGRSDMRLSHPLANRHRLVSQGVWTGVRGDGKNNQGER